MSGVYPSRSTPPLALLAAVYEDFFSLGTPERLGRPYWSGHIPFALWLVRSLRPRTLVELGTETGVSYNAFCWSVAQHATGTQCFAVDTWRGDNHAGRYSEDIFQEFSNFHRRYETFSTLIRATFDEARNQFGPGSIDLLHIDGFHTYEAVRADFESWLPCMSERGIVLLHDIRVRSGDFGVWRFWEELEQRYPTLAFDHSHGLGVVAVGTSIPMPIDILFDALAADGIRSCFHQFGSIMEERAARLQQNAGQDPTSQGAAIGWLQERLTTAETELRNADEKIQSAELERRELAAQIDKYYGKVRALECELAARAPDGERLLQVEERAERLENEATLLWRGRTGRWLRRGLIALRKIEALARRSRAFTHYQERKWIRESGLFSEHYYRSRYPDVASSGLAPLEHYVRFGAADGRWPNPLFDPEFYLRTYPDVAQARMSPLVHFIRFGTKERRNPNLFFDTEFYLQSNPDVYVSGINPLTHYLRYGEREGRQPHPLVDRGWLLATTAREAA